MGKLRYQDLNVSYCGQTKLLLKEEIWKRKVTDAEFYSVSVFSFLLSHTIYRNFIFANVLNYS